MLRKHLKPALTLWPLYIFLALYLTFALFTFKDFGISKDEPYFYQQGKILKDYFSGNYAVSEESPLPSQQKTYYGYSAFLSLINPSGSFENYHLINLLFASVIYIFSYFILYQKYKDKFLSLLGPLFIFFSTRFTGHIPINPLNVPFAVMFFVSLSVLFLFNHTTDKFLSGLFFKSTVLGLLFGLTQSLNLLGFLLYFLYLLQAIHNLIVRFKNNKLSSKFKYLRYTILELFLIFFVAIFFMVVTWPYLGSNFFANFKGLFINFFLPKTVGELIFYLGEFTSSLSLPWHYPFVWLLLTLPAMIVVLYLLSLVFTFRKLNDDLFVLNSAAIILAFIVFYLLKEPLSEGLGQFIFLIPLICLNAALVITEILFEAKNIFLKKLMVIIFLMSFLSTTVTSFLLHPYEYLYFNESAGDLSTAAKLFELDYLQTTNNEVSQWIINDIAKNTLKEPKVFSCQNVKAYEYFGEGIFEVTNKSEEADYLVCPRLIFDLEPTKQIIRGGVVLNNITKIHHTY